MTITIQDEVRVTIIENFCGVLFLSNSQSTPSPFETGEPDGSPVTTCEPPAATGHSDEKPNPAEFPLFRTDKYPLEECRKQLREALIQANSKAEACRNIYGAQNEKYIG